MSLKKEMDRFSEYCLNFSDNHDYDSKIKINGFTFKLCSSRIKLTIGFLMEKIQIAVVKKYEFEKRNVS